MFDFGLKPKYRHPRVNYKKASLSNILRSLVIPFKRFFLKKCRWLKITKKLKGMDISELSKVTKNIRPNDIRPN